MNMTLENAIINVVFVEHFETEEDAKDYAEEMLESGYACNLFSTPLGHFVCVLEVALSE